MIEKEKIISHTITIKTEVRDAVAVGVACQRLRLPQPVQGKVKLFSGEAEGLAVQLPGWLYPVICDTTAGRVQFDNFDGRWGDSRQLDRFLQAYAVCKAKIEARRCGKVCIERSLDDGSIQLTIQVAGGVS